MFDIAFSELIVIGAVALVVVGPERLPRVARTAGHLLGRMQRYANQIKGDIDREMQLEELRKLKSQVQDEASAFGSSLKGEMQVLERGLNQPLEAALEPVAVEEPDPPMPAYLENPPREVERTTREVDEKMVSDKQ